MSRKCSGYLQYRVLLWMVLYFRYIVSLGMEVLNMKGATKTCAISGRPHRSNHWAFVAKCFCSSKDILAFAVVACFCSYWRCYSPARLFLIEIIVLFPINFKGWLVLLPNFQLQKLQVSVCISTTKKMKSKKVQSPKMFEFQNSENFQQLFRQNTKMVASL